MSRADRDERWRRSDVAFDLRYPCRVSVVEQCLLEIDVGRVVFETLSAALDPYPRKNGASLEWQDPESAEGVGASGPFGALKKLKDQP